MSNTDNTSKEFREELDTDHRQAMAILRRMEIRLTGTPWQVVGHLLLDNVTRETRDAEMFAGQGFYARPPAGANCDAMVAFPAGSSNPVIIASRDEDTRRKVANIDQDEAIAYTTKAVMHIDKAGRVHARLANGTTHELAFASELNDLRKFVMQQFSGAGHVHAVTGGSTTGTTPVVTPVAAPTTAYPGTTVLRGQ